MNKVHLRRKELKNGMISLYLDFWPPLTRPDTLKATRREFLKLYLYPHANSSLKKQHNSDTLALAEAIKATRQVDIQNNFYGFISSKGKSITVIEYFHEQVKKRGIKDENWISAEHHIKRFFGRIGNVKLSELTMGHCNQYREFILTASSIKSPSVKLHQNSALSYFNKFKAMLKQAYKEGLFKNDLNARIDRIKETDTVKEYLSIEELRLLNKTECKSVVLKSAALFSALTGIRFGDLLKLVWGDIRYSELTGYALHFRQGKTKGVEVLPVSAEAIALLGERRNDSDKVFIGLRYSSYISLYIKMWLVDAKISKSAFTFHCFRHTFATMQLTLGTDIYTVSKMLGHKNISTTQVYAKVIDQKKRDACNKISLL